MLSHREILSIKVSWTHIVMFEQEIGIQFYQRLFEINPKLKHLFSISIEKQAKKIMDTLTFIVKCLQNTENFDHNIDELARKHDQYHVQAIHYEQVGRALIDTLKNVLEHNWTIDMEIAWVKLYIIISDKMLRSQMKLASLEKSELLKEY
jgi:nitric oxide dioxygenase